MQVILIICCGTEIRKKLLLNLNNIPLKNKVKQQELINYLKKHIAEIIDYEKRQLAEDLLLREEVKKLMIR